MKCPICDKEYAFTKPTMWGGIEYHHIYDLVYVVCQQSVESHWSVLCRFFLVDMAMLVFLNRPVTAKNVAAAKEILSGDYPVAMHSLLELVGNSHPGENGVDLGEFIRAELIDLLTYSGVDKNDNVPSELPTE